MESASTPKPSSAEQREHFLQAALDLLESRGPSALNVREIAKAAGTSTMGLYTHFGSKNGLVEALYLRGAEILNRELGSLAATDDPAEDVFELSAAFRRFALEHTALHSIMFERAARGFRPSDKTRAVPVAVFGVLVGRVSRWLGEEGAKRTSYIIWSSTYGLVSFELIHREWEGPAMEHLQDIKGAEIFEGCMRQLLGDIGSSRAR